MHHGTVLGDANKKPYGTPKTVPWFIVNGAISKPLANCKYNRNFRYSITNKFNFTKISHGTDNVSKREKKNNIVLRFTR